MRPGLPLVFLDSYIELSQDLIAWVSCGIPIPSPRYTKGVPGWDFLGVWTKMTESFQFILILIIIFYPF
jgi:hypothetical protein